MSKKLSRFLNIELDRPARRDEPRSAPEPGGRFDVVETLMSPSSPSAPPVAPERFAPPEPAPERLELAERRPITEVFVRCVRCQADSGVHAERCLRCGADFDTPEQRAFNERFRVQLAEETRRTEEAELRRQEALTREVAEGRAERERELLSRAEDGSPVFRWVLPEWLTRWLPFGDEEEGEAGKKRSQRGESLLNLTGRLALGALGTGMLMLAAREIVAHDRFAARRWAFWWGAFGIGLLRLAIQRW